MLSASGASRVWKQIARGQDGWFSSPELSGGYAYFTLVSDQRRCVILEAAGQGTTWVNSVPRGGDPYAFGFMKLPVELLKGQNRFLFSVPRGRLQIRLANPVAPVSIGVEDPTLPDLVVGHGSGAWGAVVIRNATNQWSRGLSIQTSGNLLRTDRRPVPDIAPLSIRKIPIWIQPKTIAEPGNTTIDLEINGPHKYRVTQTLQLRVRRSNETRKETFRSNIDGSVQYYAVNPATVQSGNTALVLSLHGAGVEAIGQADAYQAKDWAHIVCPTNRRPYGFDWEDWGRIDALEVLDIAIKRLKPNPTRILLTGHSMGGHGSWQVGATFPGRFAAVGPAAGWASFFSYTGTPRNTNAKGVLGILNRASNSSDTMTLLPNMRNQSIYILHGDADESVPVREARQMRDALAKFHSSTTYYEKVGGSHWWGNDAVDWPPMFRMFEQQRLTEPLDRTEFAFITANPAVSSICYWVQIQQQIRPLDFSRIEVRKLNQNAVAIQTSNIACFSLDSRAFAPKNVDLFIDGQQVVANQLQGLKLTLARKDGRWKHVAAPSETGKSPQRGGPFKLAFDNRFQFVFGTRGNTEESNWAFEKARYDAETWYYRANGDVDLIPDSHFDPKREVERNVIVYGNTATHRWWDTLLGECPMRIEQNRVRMGTLWLSGDDLASVGVYPRPLALRSLVGFVGGTGIRGMKATDRMPYFVSGVGISDFFVMSADIWRNGQNSIWSAGFFNNDWRVSKSDMVWRQRGVQQ